MGVSVLDDPIVRAIGSLARRRCRLTAIALVAGALAVGTGPAAAQNPPAAERPGSARGAAAGPSRRPQQRPILPHRQRLTIPIVLARQLRDDPPPLSLLDLPPADRRHRGCQARHQGQQHDRPVPQSGVHARRDRAGEPRRAHQGRAGEGRRRARTSCSPTSTPATLLKLADAVADKGVLIINYGAPDDSLREEDCRANVMHSAPTRTMLADALAQYLVWKKWPRWLLVVGDAGEGQALRRRHPPRRQALRRQDRRGAHLQLSSAAAAAPTAATSRFSSRSPPSRKSAPDHDVLLVADEGNLFGDYFPYRTWDRAPRRRHRGPRAHELASRRSSCGAARNSRTASSAWPTAPCGRSTTTPGSPRA